jgi:hypothetical protein
VYGALYTHFTDDVHAVFTCWPAHGNAFRCLLHITSVFDGHLVCNWLRFAQPIVGVYWCPYTFKEVIDI